MEAFQTFRRQIFTAFAGNLGALTFGAAWSWTATALPSMDAEAGWTRQIDSDQESLISSILFLGCLVSSPITSFCIERLGRRGTLLLANVPCLVAWVMIAFAPSLPWIYAGRFLTGVGTGTYGCAAPLYVAETSHASVRGRLVCTFDLMVATGMLLMNVVGSFTPWRIQALACAVIPIVGHLLLLIAPESPRFLLEKGRTHEGMNALSWLQPRNDSHAIEKELVEIAERVSQDKELRSQVIWWRLIRKRSVAQPILLGCMLMALHQFSGNYPIQAYGVNMLNQATGAGAGSNTAYGAMVIINGAQFVSSFIPVFLVDKIGRRPLLLISEVGMGLMLAIFGLYFSLQVQGEWIAISVLVIYEICFSIGIGPLPFLLMGELVSPQLVGASLFIITFVYRLLGFAELYLFYDLMELLGQAGIFYFFASCCIAGAVACFALVPDTTGKSLDEIHHAGDEDKKDGTTQDGAHVHGQHNFVVVRL